jgi:hypothetical protein
MSLRIWPKPLSTTTISSTSCRRFSTRATMNKNCFTSFVGRLARFPCWRGHLRPLLSDGCGCSGHGGEIHGVSRGHRHGAQDAISLSVLMRKCCALLRMRTLSISCAKGLLKFLVEMSTMTNLAGETIDARCVGCVYIYTYICMIDNRIQRRETRSR